MNAHRSKSRKRRIAHLVGLLRTDGLIHVPEAETAFIRAGWSPPADPVDFLARYGMRVLGF